MVNLRKNIARRMKSYLCRRMNIPFPEPGVPAALSPYLMKNQPIVLVDAGASRGDFTRMISGYSGISRGVLVEPLPDDAAKLRLLYPAPVFTVIEGALDASPGPREFHVNDFKETSSLLPIRRGIPELSGIELGLHSVIACRAYTLHEVLAAERIGSVDLLKLDVQGKEDDVLAGAGPSLGTVSMIWTEVSFRRLYEQSCTFFEVYARLNAAGFALMAIEPGFRAPNGELLQADALFVNNRVQRGGPRGGIDRQGER